MQEGRSILLAATDWDPAIKDFTDVDDFGMVTVYKDELPIAIMPIEQYEAFFEVLKEDNK